MSKTLITKIPPVLNKSTFFDIHFDAAITYYNPKISGFMRFEYISITKNLFLLGLQEKKLIWWKQSFDCC